MGETPEQSKSSAASVGNGERTKLEELMQQVDTLMPSPSARAARIWNELDKKDYTLWDLACFCVEALGHFSTVMPEFEEDAKKLNLLLYATHYRGAQTIIKWEQLEGNKLNGVEIEK
jgi:hypothetical protein